MKVCLGCRGTWTDTGWACPACGNSPGSWGGGLAFAPDICQGDGRDAEYAMPEIAAAEPVHFWFRARRQLLSWALRRYFPEARSFLEVGCGTGYVLSGLLEAMPGLDATGTDVLAEALSYAQGRLPGVRLIQMDARRIPFRDEFDAAGAFDVLEHVEQDEDVLAELARAVHPGGGLFLTVPQHAFLWTEVDDFSRHVRRYDRADLLRKVRRAGFEVLRVTSFFSLTLPLFLLARLRPRRARRDFDATAELRIPRPMNTCLDVLSRSEGWLLRRGLSFPAGGSLLVVARRAGPIPGAAGPA